MLSDDFQRALRNFHRARESFVSPRTSVYSRSDCGKANEIMRREIHLGAMSREKRRCEGCFGGTMESFSFNVSHHIVRFYDIRVGRAYSGNLPN